MLTDVSRCTIQLPDGSPCGQPGAHGMPFPVCGRHAAQLYRHLVKLMGEYDSQPLARMQMFVDAIEEQRAAAHNKAARRPPVVYYVQVGELIKIGHTSLLRQRMASYPPISRLLATEPGGVALERQRHQQFAELLCHGDEWFSPAPTLLDHINALRAKADAEPIALFV